MTSLANQLKRLALPQSSPDLLTRREVASLLFDPKEAATMDRSTFYALGCTGLEELLGIEPAFQEFQDTLFSPASLTLERSVQSRDVNEKLDAGISLFLTRLCPYFLLRPAHKCIEWLVHRFHIHVYNTDALVSCALPYHDTNVFVRVVQLLKIKDASDRWSWLRCLQKPGVPLSRGALVSRCYSDLSFMDFICSSVTRSIQAYSGHSETFSQLRVVFSFFASTVVMALDAMGDVSDAVIAKLLPYIHKGLRASLGDYKAAAYMLVSQLAVKVRMDAALLDSLVLQVSRSLLRAPVLPQEGLGCLVLLLQSQKEGAAGPRAATHLSSMGALASSLQAMALMHDVSPLLGYLLPHLLHARFSDEEEPDQVGMLESILKSVPLTKDLDRTVARLLLDGYLSQTERSPEDMSALDQRLLPLVRLFESRYSGALDGILAGHMMDIGDTQRKQLYHRFLSLSMSSGKYQILGDSDTSLLLSMKHPQPSVRVLALEHLMGVATSGQRQSLDAAFLRDAMSERLHDDVPEVVTAALKLLQVLLDAKDPEGAVDPEDAVSHLLSLLHRAHGSDAERWLPVLAEVVHLLSHPRLGKGDGELLLRTSWKLLPFLVTTSPRPSLARAIARSPLLTHNPLTQNWAQELDEVEDGEADFVGSANQRLVAMLSRNLNAMEHFARRDALEELVLLAEQHGAPGPRGRACWAVLTRTLLLGLEQLSPTQHLLTAQRIYVLLERPLLELGTHHGSQAEPPVTVPAAFPEALGLYLSRCERRADPDFGGVLLCLLRDFLAALRCPDASFKGEAWWNPERLDASTCCYLGLLCRAFSLTITGAAQGPAAPGFRAAMKLLVQVHLSAPLHLFRFLSVLWGCGGSHGDQLDVQVGAVLQTRALCVGGALLGNQPAEVLDRLAAADSPVVPSLLCCLATPVREVRRAALGALLGLSAASGSPFQPITARLLQTQEEITADPAYLNTVLAGLHDDSPAALQPLLVALRTPSCPSYVAAAVLRGGLGLVGGESVLETLLPVLERLLEPDGPDAPPLLRAEARLLQLVLGKVDLAAAPLLVRDSRARDLFLRALRTPGCQNRALEQISRPFFGALGDRGVQQQLLSLMFDLLADGRKPAVAAAVASAFKSISVEAELVANELVPAGKAAVGATVQQTRRTKTSLRKAADGGGVAPAGGAVSWPRVTLILELLQHKKKLKQAHMLVPALFTLLARSLEAGPGDHGNMEYTKQLLLSCLLNICDKLAADGGQQAAGVLDEDRFSVELVVQVIRGSDMPQTHHHALMLLGTVAAIFPDKVLHNVMSIFTFMGASLLRRDDAYSFRVIQRTLQTVVPALLKAHQLPDGTSSPRMVATVTRIVHVFADALPHVPEHRRLPVLSQLVATLGPAHFLWVLLLLLFKLPATKASGPPSERDAALERDLDFWVSLSCCFPVTDQMTSLINILNFLLQLPDDKDDAAAKRPIGRQTAPRKKKKEEEEETVEELIFSVEAHSSKELRHFKFLSVSFMAQLLGSSCFIHKVADGGEDMDVSLQPLQQRLLEDVLRYVHAVARCAERHADEPTAKFWRVLLNKAYDVLDKVNALMPTDTFITVVRGLMGNQLASVRRKAMELLNNRLQQRSQWDQQQVAALLQLTGELLSIVGNARAPASEGQEVEQAVNRQTALYSLKLLCRNFGSDHQEAFLPVLLRAVDIIMAADEEKNVTGSALLCVAEVVGALKALAIPQLPRLMPTVLHALADRKELLTNEIYLLSAVTALQRVAETLPHFISPYLQDTTLQVCRLTRLVESSSSSSSSSSSQLSARLTSLRSTLATKLPPRVLLPTISRCYSSLETDRKEQLGALMSILKEHIDHMDKEQLSVHQSELSSFFLTALDFRSKHNQDDLQRTFTVEGHVIDCLISMVMKLSEVTFRPLFFKLLDWSKASDSERLLTFYRLCERVAERLKGLFVLFAGNLVKPMADLLKRTHSSTTDVLAFGSDSQEKTCLLLRSVLDCLQKIFLYDTQRFLSRERADTLLAPLVDQLENVLGGEQEYRRRVTQHLLPCLGQFSVAAADDSQWKSLNYQILLKTRHSDAKVRFSSLLMLTELASRLKENYVVLLPETIPFLAELMEDECEEVEHQVQKVVQEMENILGEPLQSYF